MKVLRFSVNRACIVLLAWFALNFHVRAEIQHVIAISIDGGRGDFIRTFIETAPAEFPNFKRLRDLSAHTFNARTDYTDSMTIPDHLSMLTGRPVRRPTGLPATLPHGYFEDVPPSTDTVHNSGLNPNVYKASIFDVVHDHGLSTALYVSKTRLQICERSWNATNGAPDTTGTDNGRNKIDVAMVVQGGNGSTATADMLTSFVATIQNGTLKNFTFFHIADTDYAGHNTSWSTAAGGTYRTVMRVADGWIGQILDAVQGNASLIGKVAIMLTADHGGGSPPNNHMDATHPMNYTIPFFLIAPGIPGGSNIHEHFENRVDPTTTRPAYTAVQQPMRNGDVANLSAALLGLPTVPGSLMVPELKKPLSIEREPDHCTISWPAFLTGHTLESTIDLSTPEWTPVTAGIEEVNGRKRYKCPITQDSTRFFRLRRPANGPALKSAATSLVADSATPASVGTLEQTKTVRKQKRSRALSK